MKNAVLKSIAETGYNVGFGAKKHFATYDIVNKIPGIINIFAISFGIYALVIDSLSAKSLSALILVLGVIGLYISMYETKKSSYDVVGKKFTEIYNDLCQLYREVKFTDEADLSLFDKRHADLRKQFYDQAISDQILFSDWYAHYKFFWQHQIDWINEQKKFSLFRDKIPLSFLITIVFIIIFIIWQFGCFNNIIAQIKNLCS